MKLFVEIRKRKLFPSLPVRGAWIEISSAEEAVEAAVGRSPCGERGLKSFVQVDADDFAGSLPVRGAWIEIDRYTYEYGADGVAPRAGSVD